MQIKRATQGLHLNGAKYFNACNFTFRIIIDSNTFINIFCGYGCFNKLYIKSIYALYIKKEISLF